MLLQKSGFKGPNNTPLHLSLHSKETPVRINEQKLFPHSCHVILALFEQIKNLTIATVTWFPKYFFVKIQIKALIL